MIIKRQITWQLGQHKIINEMWTCPSCIKEINSIEWFCEIKSTNQEYLTTHSCPACNKKQEN